MSALRGTQRGRRLLTQTLLCAATRDGAGRDLVMRSSATRLLGALASLGHPDLRMAWLPSPDVLALATGPSYKYLPPSPLLHPFFFFPPIISFHRFLKVSLPSLIPPSRYPTFIFPPAHSLIISPFPRADLDRDPHYRRFLNVPCRAALHSVIDVSIPDHGPYGYQGPKGQPCADSVAVIRSIRRYQLHRLRECAKNLHGPAWQTHP